MRPVSIQRRSLLQWLATLGASVRCSGWFAWAQTADFPDAHGDTLAALAAVVLPSELGPDGIHDVVRRFQGWVRNYRAGAEMDHGYGFTRLRAKGSSPAPVYLRQLETLQPALSSGDADTRRRAVEAALEEAKITDLPRSPDGRHIAADLMSFFFRSSDANDLCYRAAIGRDLCRGLKGSEKPPAPLARSNGAAR